MKRPLSIIILLLCICSCGRNSQSISNDAMAQYRDTIVGKFNGIDIDTLICEPIDTIKERAYWDWLIYSKNNTVDTLILTQRFIVKMIQEGDLDGNGTDEFGIRRESDAGTWDNYYIYTFHHWCLLKNVNKKLLNSVFISVTRFLGLKTLSHFSNNYIGVGASKLGSPIFHECRTIYFQPDC